MKRSGAIVQVDGSSFAERDLPSPFFSHPSPPKKGARYSAAWRRDIGLWVLTSGRSKATIEHRIKFHSPFFPPCFAPKGRRPVSCIAGTSARPPLRPNAPACCRTDSGKASSCAVAGLAYLGYVVSMPISPCCCTVPAGEPPQSANHRQYHKALCDQRFHRRINT
jgi:hypothetical protein